MEDGDLGRVSTSNKNRDHLFKSNLQREDIQEFQSSLEE